MGDRCWLNINVRTDHLDLLVGAIGDEGDEVEECEGEGYTSVIFYEANYALYDELVEACARGAHFLARNGPGDNYGPCAVIGFLGSFYEVATDNEGGYIVRVNNRGDPVQVELADVRQFIEIEARLWQDFSGDSPNGPNTVRGTVPLSEWKTCDKTQNG